MNSNKKPKSLGKRISEFLFWVCAAVSGLFDKSMTARIAKTFRRKAITLYTRVIGLFFLTFGVYSFLIALLLKLFTDRQADPSSLYGGIIMALAAIPLVFSRGNVSTALCQSVFGELLCDYLNIRKNTLDTSSFSGHLSIAFVMGVIAGASTVIFPLSSIMTLIILAVMTGLILSSPETGMIFMTIIIFTADPPILYTVIGVTAISYIFKIIRKKRKFIFKKTDAVLLIFGISVAGGAFFCIGSASSLYSLRFAALLIPYYLFISLLRDRNRIIKVINTAVFSLGTVCILYTLGYAVNVLVPVGAAVDKGFLLKTVLAFPIFESGTIPVSCAALIPISLAFTIRPRRKCPRMTYCLCLVAMTATLILTDNAVFALAAAAVCVLFLLTTGSRRIYLCLCAVLSSGVIFSFSGVFGNRVYRYAFRQISETLHTAKDLSYTSGISLSDKYATCGQGFCDLNELHANFYESLLAKLGIAGFVILAAFVIFVIAEAISLVIKAYRSKSAEASCRFKDLTSTKETRMCTTSLICSVVSCLVCAAFFDFHSSEAAYMVFFLSCGICSAYARSAKSEIASAEGCIDCNSSDDRFTTVL